MRDRPEVGPLGARCEVSDAIAASASNDPRWVTLERIEVSGGSLL